MERRKILKAIVGLPLLPLIVKDEDVGKVIEIDPKSKYIVLIRASSRLAYGEALEQFCNTRDGLPIGTPVFVVDDPEEDIKILKL